MYGQYYLYYVEKETAGIHLALISPAQNCQKLLIRERVTDFLFEFLGYLVLSGKLMDYKYEEFSLLECIRLSLHCSESDTCSNGEPAPWWLEDRLWSTYPWALSHCAAPYLPLCL